MQVCGVKVERRSAVRHSYNVGQVCSTKASPIGFALDRSAPRSIL